MCRGPKAPGPDHVPMRDLETEAIIDAVIRVVREHGVESLGRSRWLSAILADYMPGVFLERERNVVLIALSAGLDDLLVKGMSLDSSQRSLLIARGHRLLVEEVGFAPMRSGELLGALSVGVGWSDPPATPGPTSVAVGRRIRFGPYWWSVLAVEARGLLLLTEEVTDIGKPFNSDEEPARSCWADCSLRWWLQTAFASRFAPEELHRIVPVEHVPDANPAWGTAHGRPVTDNFFLLSVEELLAYVASLRGGGAAPHDAVAASADKRLERVASYRGEPTWWWLRTPGRDRGTATYVNRVGAIMLGGELCFDDGGSSCVGVRPGVRPAVWITSQGGVS